MANELCPFRFAMHTPHYTISRHSPNCPVPRHARNLEIWTQLHNSLGFCMISSRWTSGVIHSCFLIEQNFLPGMLSDGKAPYESQQVAPCENDYELSCVRTSDDAPTQLHAVETLELGHLPAEPTFPQLSKTRTVLLICTISSAGLLTVCLFCFCISSIP